MAEIDHDREANGTDIRLHTHTGCEGFILELRPEGQGFPAERDMTHLSESELQELHDRIGEALDSADPDRRGGVEDGEGAHV